MDPELQIAIFYEFGITLQSIKIFVIYCEMDLPYIIFWHLIDNFYCYHDSNTEIRKNWPAFDGAFVVE